MAQILTCPSCNGKQEAPAEAVPTVRCQWCGIAYSMATGMVIEPPVAPGKVIKPPAAILSETASAVCNQCGTENEVPDEFAEQGVPCRTCGATVLIPSADPSLPASALYQPRANEPPTPQGRPTSITVIGWILIVLGIVALCGVPMSVFNPEVEQLMARSPIPVQWQYFLMVVGPLLMVFCGQALLNRQNWARWLYVGWNVLSAAINLATSPMKLLIIPSLLVFLVITFFLFLPAANRYFRAEGQ